MDDADAIVVGAGIQGATLAREMARRGLRAIVIDSKPPGSGNTAASFGILHGGLRYLQRLDVGRWLRSRQEQTWFARTFSDLVQPLPVAMPLYEGCLRSPALFRAAFAAERWAAVACGVRAATTPGWVDTGSRAVLDYPVPRAGLVGTARWNELVLTDARAAVCRLLGRHRSDAEVRLVNGEAVGLITRGNALTGVLVSGMGGETELSARVVVLCAGAQTRTLARRFDRDLPRLSSARLAFNLLLDLPAPPGVVLAVSATAGRGRSLFLRADAGKLLAGTWYAPGGEQIHASHCGGVPAPLVDGALDELRRALPSLCIDHSCVVDIRAGHLPDTNAGHRLRERDVLINHRRHGGPAGLWSVLGVKLTTARALSARAVQRIWPQAQGAFPASDGPRAARGAGSAP